MRFVNKVWILNYFPWEVLSYHYREAVTMSQCPPHQDLTVEWEQCGHPPGGSPLQGVRPGLAGGRFYTATTTHQPPQSIPPSHYPTLWGTNKSGTEKHWQQNLFLTLASNLINPSWIFKGLLVWRHWNVLVYYLRRPTCWDLDWFLGNIGLQRISLLQYRTIKICL